MRRQYQPKFRPERALIARDWYTGIATARIVAMVGEGGLAIVNRAGGVFYVILGACREAEIPVDDLDVRILRGAVNAVYDQAENDSVDELQRQAIVGGLEASVRLIERLEHAQLVRAACDLSLKLRRQHVHMSDFDGLANYQFLNKTLQSA